MKTKICFLYHRIIVVVALSMGASACDLSHMQRCEWYLMPNPSDDWMARVDDGYIPVCARNLETNKENCDLQATLDFSEKHYGQKFRYSEIDLDKSGKFPRKVVGLKACENDDDASWFQRWLWQFDDWLLKRIGS